ncbi:MAG TPA: DUF2721 domain-containing protein [Urbifossiella sp.]|nr:DUF2721 domain-containing protein [Urbifossiella sp.]
MFDASDYKLTDLLGSAGATIGVIIGGTIFLQFLSSKYVELANRLRELTREYRERKGDEPRHGPLADVIRIYRRRLMLLIRASWLAGGALLFFLAAVLAGGLSMAYPPVVAFKAVGSVGLLIGLLLIGAGVALELWESVLARHEIRDELADLDDGVKAHHAA